MRANELALLDEVSGFNKTVLNGVLKLILQHHICHLLLVSLRFILFDGSLRFSLRGGDSVSSGVRVLINYCFNLGIFLLLHQLHILYDFGSVLLRGNLGGILVLVFDHFCLEILYCYYFP